MILKTKGNSFASDFFCALCACLPQARKPSRPLRLKSIAESNPHSASNRKGRKGRRKGRKALAVNFSQPPLDLCRAKLFGIKKIQPSNSTVLSLHLEITDSYVHNKIM